MKRFLKSVKFAIQGLQYMLPEPNFRIHLVVAIGVITLSFWLGLSATEWMIIIGCIATTMGAEMFNTAIEHLCNLSEPNLHPVIKKVKDTSAAAVFTLALAAAICGFVVLLPKIIFIIQHHQP